MKDINDASPTAIGHLIGNDAAKRAVQVALDYAQTEGVSFPSAMLLGPPGQGKSTLAQVIANEMAADFQEVLGQSLTTVADLNQLLLAATHRSVVHIDEAHEMAKVLMTSLYLALDKRTVFANVGGRAPQPIPIQDFTLLISTTDEFKILEPMRHRMRMVIRLTYLSVEELAQVVYYRARALNWELHESVLPLIAQRSKGTPRLALRLLQSCRRVCRAEGSTTIDVRHLETACTLDQIESGYGLDATEQEYLKILNDGGAHLNVIASRLGLPSRTVSEVTEVYLLRAGLICKTKDSLRELTRQGREHLSKLCSEDER